MYHERDSTRQNDRLRQGETESEVCGQSAKQPAMQSCIQTARQTTCPVTVHLPGERGQRPSPVSVHFIETLKRNNYWAGASGGLCFWLRNRHYSVVTGGPCCLSEDLSFTETKHILLAFSELKILRLKNYFGSWTWSISHVNSGPIKIPVLFLFS